MTDNHPITPPTLLVEQWLEQCLTSRELAAKAFQAGADQELEACCEWFRVKGYHPWVYRDLRDIRRPKPPSKKQRGLTALEATNLKKDDPLLYQEILNAIEGLPDD